MTLERDAVTSDLFGLVGTFPHPGWVVLDAARAHRFTGELTFATLPAVTVYLDVGHIYLAERVTDPSLGSRLVDAGALNAAQLQHGSMVVGKIAHLGRLFERVPSVNRQSVLVVTEMMTEECVGWLAGQLVHDVVSTPYRHHPAGVQRWMRPGLADEPAPGDPLPSPAPDEAPVEVPVEVPVEAPVEAMQSETLSSLEAFDDDLIEWDQSLRQDQRSSGPPRQLLDDGDRRPESHSRASARVARRGARAVDPVGPYEVSEGWLDVAPADVDDLIETFEPVDAEPMAAVIEPELGEQLAPDPDPGESALTAPSQPPAPDLAPVDLEPVDLEPVDLAPLDLAPLESAPLDLEPLESAPLDLEPVDLEPLDLAPVDSFAAPPVAADAWPAMPPPGPAVPDPTVLPGPVQAPQPAAATEVVSEDSATEVASTAVVSEDSGNAPFDAPSAPQAWPPQPLAATGDWAELIAAVAEPTAAPGSASSPAPALQGPAELEQQPMWASQIVGPPASPIKPTEAPPSAVTDRADRVGPSVEQDGVPSHRSALEGALDQASAVSSSRQRAAESSEADPGEPAVLDDWVERLDSEGLPDRGSERSMTTDRPMSVPAPPLDRFEVIWPSGEVDEQLGTTDAAAAERRPKTDQVGATAGVTASIDTPDTADIVADTADIVADTPLPALERRVRSAGGDIAAPSDEVTDEVVLAVRRAVASVDTGSLAARRRLAATSPDEDLSRGFSPRPSEALRSLRPEPLSSHGGDSVRRASTGSVFDDDRPPTPAAAPTAAPAAAAPAPTLPPRVKPVQPVAADSEGRTGALRRLIGSLRRR